MFEVHDCFSVTELVTMEDLHISRDGQGLKDVLDGFYDADGKIPCQIDGGLKCFGHPIGASGLRMLYEMYLQFQGRAGARQLKDAAHRPDPQSRRLPAAQRVPPSPSSASTGRDQSWRSRAAYSTSSVSLSKDGPLGAHEPWFDKLHHGRWSEDEVSNRDQVR